MQCFVIRADCPDPRGLHEHLACNPVSGTTSLLHPGVTQRERKRNVNGTQTRIVCESMQESFKLYNVDRFHVQYLRLGAITSILLEHIQNVVILIKDKRTKSGEGKRSIEA